MASPSAAKKRKVTESGDTNHQLIETVTAVKALLEPLETILSLRNKIKVLRVALGDVVKENFNEDVLTILNQRFPVDGDKGAQITIRDLNRKLDELSEEYQSCLAYAHAIPPPSSYAQCSIWAEWQEKPTAVLCFRPSDKQGLPLCILDNVFREFQRQARAPLPLIGEDARKAMNAAFDLCHMMPKHFDTEYDRGQVFDKCLDPILPNSSWHEKLHLSAPTELRSGNADRAYVLDGVVRILREDKVETGTGDDVYMQLSRVYQLYVESVRKKNAPLFDQGVPVILLCVLGPILLICGGFHDGKSTIVEPLVEPCLMFGDCLHVRQEALARQLFALKRALDTLRSRSPPDGGTANPHPAGVPRVYTTYTMYTTEDNAEHSLIFLRPLEKSLPQHLLFIAADSLDPSTHKLVKLVGKGYGVTAHRLLAERQFAPVLYGQSSLEGAPTAYIMEYLSPPTDSQSGWVTLFEFLKSKDLATRYSHLIGTALTRILTMMEEAKVVHGDLRPNNVMLEVKSDKTPVCSGEEQKVNLKVVDFDWAGQSGEVCYPLQRNEDITWPGDAGTPIIVGHDRLLVKDWWFKQFT